MLAAAELEGLEIDLGIARVPIRWLLASPVAVGEEGAGAVVIGSLVPPSKVKEGVVRDAARQLSVALHNAWTHQRLQEKSEMLEVQGRELSQAGRVKDEFLAARATNSEPRSPR